MDKNLIGEWKNEKQDIKIIMANDEPELVEKKLNSLTEKGYKLQSSN